MTELRLPDWDCPVDAVGDSALWQNCKTAFVSSRRYPARAVLPVFDWARQARENGECVVSGFHSRLERETLDILLRGEQPIVIVAARGIYSRLPPHYRREIDRRRLLALFPFPAKIRRSTRQTAARRNRFMLAAAARIVAGFVDPQGDLATAIADFSRQKPLTILSA